MARTPLMRFLQQTIANADAAATGVSAPAPWLMSRRSALATAAAAALFAPRFARAGTAPRIGIVGAGLAGLTAAYMLKQSGVTAQVFEASTRLGGRCFSSRGFFEDGQIAEHGGEFIDTGHHEIRGLAKTLGLPLDDVLKATPANTGPLWFFDGAPYTVDQATADFAPVRLIVHNQVGQAGASTTYDTATPFAKKLDAMTIAQWVAKFVPGGRTSRLGQLIENAYQEEDAAIPELQSALVLVQGLVYSPKAGFSPYAYSDQRFHVRGGNDQIPSRMAAALPGQINTGMVLSAIVTNTDGSITLTFGKDTASVSQTFDRVILALPFSVLAKSVDFSKAGFSALKTLAITTLGMGVSTKLQLQYTRRPWYDAGSNGEIRLPAPFQTTWDVTRAQPGTLGIFNYWSGGPTAIQAGQGDPRLAALAASTAAETVIPGLTALWNRRFIINAWGKNPWSHGSYVYFAPNQTTTFHGIEPIAEGNCHFAGEHTSLAAQGFLNGAVETGMRAAQEVLVAMV